MHGVGEADVLLSDFDRYDGICGPDDCDVPWHVSTWIIDANTAYVVSGQIESRRYKRLSTPSAFREINHELLAWVCPEFG